MWMLRLKSGIELTEKDVGVWDNVPADAEISSVGLAIARGGGQLPYVIDVRGFEEVCVARMGSSIGGRQKMIGFVVFGVANDHVTEFTIRTDGVGLKSYHRDKLTLRPECLRRMTI